MKTLKKEDVINLGYKDIACLIMETEKKGFNTLELFTKIVELCELPLSTVENKIGDFYTSLTTDKRFILVDGIWDLRKRHKSDKIIVDSIDDDETIDTENMEEEKIIEDNYDDDYIDNMETRDDDYDTPETDDDDLSELAIIDEEDMG